MKILLTGGTGLVGRTLVPLIRGDHDIVHFDVQDPDDGLPFISGDLRDGEAVLKACEGADVIIHIAALHGGAWQAAGDNVGFEVNVTGTKNILEAAVKTGAKRVIFTSSIWATGHLPYSPDYLPIDEQLDRQPVEMYGLTKKLGEQMCSYYSRKYGISTISLRPGGILPADDANKLRWGLLFWAVDVRDVAQAHVLALEASDELQCETLNITADSPLAQIDPAEYRKDSMAVLEKIYPGISKLIVQEQAANFAGNEWYTVSKAKRLLGYKPQYNFSIT